MPSELPRLVHHYLIEEGYVEAASLLASHCPHLKIYSQASNFNSELSIFIGPTLLDLLEDYFKAKEYVIERLKKLKSYNFRPLDSCLLTRLESLVASLVPNVQSNVRKNEGGRFPPFLHKDPCKQACRNCSLDLLFLCVKCYKLFFYNRCWQ